MKKHSDLNTFYNLLTELENRIGRKRLLRECHGKMKWPTHGIYFFFESGEYRTSDSTTPRVVRVGTHAITEKSKTTLWNRLSQHRGTKNPYGGKHRTSVFRELCGEALMNRDPTLKVESWSGYGKNPPSKILEMEKEHETRVSDYIGAMEILFLSVPNTPNQQGMQGFEKRKFIEKNCIALLSNHNNSSPDKPSDKWLGNHSSKKLVHQSGLWNRKHVDDSYNYDFLDFFKDSVKNE